MMDSKQLEKELESTIDQNERKIKELSISNNRAQNEIDAMRVCTILHNYMILYLQRTALIDSGQAGYLLQRKYESTN